MSLSALTTAESLWHAADALGRCELVRGEIVPEFLERLADLVPPRKRRHRYHGVFAPNHKLRRAVTSLATGNIGKRGDAAAGQGPPNETQAEH